MKHDHLCEKRRLVAPSKDCECTMRAYRADPFPAEDMPIYPPYVDCNARPVQTSTSWQSAWADKQIHPDEKRKKR